ncbi:MAG: DUF393 domain-containing protein [Propionibacteriaceae bacterium]|nr:DUF393 domain-containing protein [Propionibacteriaceae bacterium]
MDSRGTGVILYDADCGFCSLSIQVAAGRAMRTRLQPVMVQRADLARLGLELEPCLERLHVVDQGAVHVGSDAIAAILLTSRFPWPLLGRLLRCPGLRPLAQRGYDIVARNRHRLPGGTRMCRLDVMDS